MPDGQPSTWEEPPWSGFIETTGDALLILEAARRGLIPRVTRRLVESERKMITSGSVFVFDEDESGIKRWTDGFYWSPSRILGNFLLYRETEKKGANKGAKADAASADGVDGFEGARADNSLSRPRGDDVQMSVDKHIERNLLGSLTNSYKFKPDGLMKKTFSLTINGVSQHLISYYRIEDVTNGRLRSPSSLPELASLDISPEYLDKNHFRNPPKVEYGIDGLPRYRGEADDIETSSAQGSPSTGLPLTTNPRTSDTGGSRRLIAGPPSATKRLGSPPSSSSGAKRNRRQPKSTPELRAPSAIEQQPQSVSPSSAPPTTQVGTSNTDSNNALAAPPRNVSTPAPAATPAPPHPFPPYPIPGFYPPPPGYPMVPPHGFYPPPGVPIPHVPHIHPQPYPGASSRREVASSSQPPSEPPPTYGYPFPPPQAYPPHGFHPYGMYPPPPAPQIQTSHTQASPAQSPLPQLGTGNNVEQPATNENKNSG